MILFLRFVCCRISGVDLCEGSLLVKLLIILINFCLVLQLLFDAFLSKGEIAVAITAKLRRVIEIMLAYHSVKGLYVLVLAVRLIRYHSWLHLLLRQLWFFLFL